MNEQPKDLEERVAQLERRLKVRQYVATVIGGLLGLHWSGGGQAFPNRASTPAAQ